MDEVANPNPNPNPEPNPPTLTLTLTLTLSLAPQRPARPPAPADPCGLGLKRGVIMGLKAGRRSCKRERHDLQVPINTPSGAGLPHGPEPSAFAACMRQRGWALACALVPPPKSPTPPPLT